MLGLLPSATLDRVRDPGAPVDLYRLLEAADEPELIDREIPDNAEILELGAGSGRITHPLIALGRRVVAVDFNPEMLELIEGAETVLSRIEDLDLGRTFGGVLLMSTLINAPDEMRFAMLQAVRRHLAPNGVALIERYDPEIGNDPRPTERHLGAVTIRVSEISRVGQLIYQTIDYDAGTHGHWQIRIEGRHVVSDDEMLASLAAAHLRLLRWIDPARRWLAATIA
ncbi:MAG: class I SAM-dependent methyltransferase [Chloroflexi bacterium]|nr:MAG: class I SAM-dependent methyltransferase [Chloroflexota bacterium]